MKCPEPRKRVEQEFSMRSIDGQRIWSEEERAKFFRRSGGELAVKLMSEWCEGKQGRISSVGPLVDIAKKMPGDISEKTPEKLFDYYFHGDMAKTRDDDLHTLEYGSRRAREALANKYHCYENQLPYFIRVRNPRPQKDIIGVMRELYSDIEAGKGTHVRPGEVSFEQVCNLVINEIFDRTIVGIQREAMVENWLKENFEPYGVDVQQSDHAVDVNLGVDYELRYKGRILSGIQVKGIAMIRGDANVEAKMSRLTAQQETYRRRTGADVLMAYVSGGRDGRQMRICNQKNLTKTLEKFIRNADRDIEAYHRKRQASVNRQQSGRNTHKKQQKNHRNSYYER